MSTVIESAETAPMTTDQAFAAAKAEHSTSVEQAIEQSDKAVDESSTSETETGTAQPAEETQAEVQSSEAAPTDELLSAEEYDKVKDDPKALKKALDKAWTTKTTQLANQRKFAEAFEKDPRAAISAVAKQLGIEIVDPAKVKAEEKTEARVQASTQVLVDRLKQKLGPELGFIAEPFGEVIEGFVRELVPQLTKTEVAPLQKILDGQKEDALNARASAIRAEFFSKNKDAQKFESQIAALTAKFPIGPGVEPMEYLEGLATMAMANVAEAERVKKTIKRQSNAIKSAETKDPGVQSSRVKPTRPKNMTTEQAFQFAKQGVVFED